MSMTEDLCERVRLEAPTREEDTYGGSDVSWQLVGEYFAHVQAATARIQRAGGQIEHQAQYRITLRAPRALTSDMRIIWRDMVLAIDAITPHARSIDVTCHEERV